MPQDITPEIRGFKKKVGSLVLKDGGIGEQTAILTMQFPVEKDAGIKPHEDLIEDIEKVVQKYYSE